MSILRIPRLCKLRHKLRNPWINNIESAFSLWNKQTRGSRLVKFTSISRQLGLLDGRLVLRWWPRLEQLQQVRREPRRVALPYLRWKKSQTGSNQTEEAKKARVRVYGRGRRRLTSLSWRVLARFGPFVRDCTPASRFRIIALPESPMAAGRRQPEICEKGIPRKGGRKRRAESWFLIVPSTSGVLVWNSDTYLRLSRIVLGFYENVSLWFLGKYWISVPCVFERL